MQFTTEDGCDITLHKTPEGDLLMAMKVEPNAKGLATATVASAPEGSKVILGTYASLKLDAASREALRGALETFEDWESHPDLPDEYYPPEETEPHGVPIYDEAKHYAHLRWPIDPELNHAHREGNRLARRLFLRGVAFALAKVKARS